MRNDVRDLAHAGIYLCAVAVLTGGIALGVGAAYRTVTTMEIDAAADAQDQQEQATRISTNVQNARAIRAALAKPITRPEPLPPFTAKLAHPPRPVVGQLKPPQPPKLPKLQAEAMNAMAMDTPPVHRANPEFDRHKVY